MKNKVLQLLSPVINKSLMFNGILVVALLLASTSAYAFGGGSGGRVSAARKYGMNALGIHIGGDKQADIKFKCDDPNSHSNDQGVCECNDGYEMQDGVCVGIQPTPTCDPCEDLVDGVCTTRTCDDNMHCDATQDACTCDNGYERNTDNTCTVCTNGNLYLSYMPKFGTGACHTSTPMNQATTDCECTNSDGKCVSYESDANWNTVCAATSATLCVSNKHCSATEYCNIINIQSEKPNTGTCMPLTDGVAYTYNNKTFLRSDNRMTWWAAENWCKAKGMKLVSLASTGMDNLGDYFNNNGYCYGTGERKCENVDWDAIKIAFSTASAWWTQDAYAYDSNAAYNQVAIEQLGPSNREDSYYALCK